ncbi:MAG: alpha/beta hydrolase [Lachnospiraceae bacterium]|nr:alpha/beta hydrolase [Lachnospiraceae bacterium]
MIPNIQKTAPIEVVENPNAAIKVSPEDEYYIFDLDENVERTHVYYNNRFGIEIAADLYNSKNIEAGKKYPAIIVGPPFGGVKEQGPGVYANQLAQRGFIVLAIDPAYHGYSGGYPRYTSSSAMYAEDFSAAVDYLGNREDVDRDKIGVIGICGSGGFALSAAAMDPRIKAVATSVMYDIAGNMNAMSGVQRNMMLSQGANSRFDSFATGEYEYMKTYPDAPTEDIPVGLDETNAEFYSFYGTKRGWHPNALGNMNMASAGDLMTLPSNEHIAEIECPILFVAGENAHSLGFSQTAYENATEPKELYIVSGANHVDLYDQVDKIPFDKITDFFYTNFK